MLRVSVDIVSGRPNPTWIVREQTVTRKVMGAIGEDRRIATKPGSRFQGLGFRGVQVEELGAADDARGRALPMRFVLAAPGGGAVYTASAELAAGLIEDMVGGQ
jgi:hypothetical protein